MRERLILKFRPSSVLKISLGNNNLAANYINQMRCKVNQLLSEFRLRHSKITWLDGFSEIIHFRNICFFGGNITTVTQEELKMFKSKLSLIL
jgi:hypothetical protein